MNDLHMYYFKDCWEEVNSSKGYWYDKGCSEQVLMWFVSQLHVVGIVGLLVSFIQVTSFCLYQINLMFATHVIFFERGTAALWGKRSRVPRDGICPSE